MSPVRSFTRVHIGHAIESLVCFFASLCTRRAPLSAAHYFHDSALMNAERAIRTSEYSQ